MLVRRDERPLPELASELPSLSLWESGERTLG